MKNILILLVTICSIFAQENRSVEDILKNTDRLNKENISLAKDIGMKEYRVSVMLWAVGENEYINLAYIDSLYKNFDIIEMRDFANKLIGE